MKKGKKAGLPYVLPDIYVGSNITKYCGPDNGNYNNHCWVVNYDHYIKNIVRGVEENMMSHGHYLNENKLSCLSLDIALRLTRCLLCIRSIRVSPRIPLVCFIVSLS